MGGRPPLGQLPRQLSRSTTEIDDLPSLIRTALDLRQQIGERPCALGGEFVVLVGVPHGSPRLGTLWLSISSRPRRPKSETPSRPLTCRTSVEWRDRCARAILESEGGLRWDTARLVTLPSEF